MTRAIRFPFITILALFGFLAAMLPAHAGTVGISPGTINLVVEQGDVADGMFTLSTTPDEEITITVKPLDGNSLELPFESSYYISKDQTHVEMPFQIPTEDLEVGTYSNSFTITEAEPENIPEGFVHVALGVTAELNLEVVKRLSDRERSRLVSVDNLLIMDPEYPGHPRKVQFEVKNDGQFQEKNLVYHIDVYDRDGNVVMSKVSDPFSLSAGHTSPIKIPIDPLEDGQYDVKVFVDFRDFQTDILKQNLTINVPESSSGDGKWILLFIGTIAIVGGAILLLRQKNRQASRKKR